MLKLLYNIVLNNIMIKKYNNGEYSTNMAQALIYLNFPEKYIANYNYGNILYQNGEYDASIEQYKKAIENNIPEKRECKVRINYALAICKTVELDEDSIKSAIRIYESAIDVLTEKGCANKDDNNGHSQDAEKLKQEIQKEIERLKKLLQNKSKNNENDDQKDNEDNNNSEDDSTEEKEDEIQKIKEDAIKAQRDKEQKYKNANKTITNKYNKNW